MCSLLILLLSRALSAGTAFYSRPLPSQQTIHQATPTLWSNKRGAKRDRKVSLTTISQLNWMVQRHGSAVLEHSEELEAFGDTSFARHPCTRRLFWRLFLLGWSAKRNQNNKYVHRKVGGNWLILLISCFHGIPSGIRYLSFADTKSSLSPLSPMAKQMICSMPHLDIALIRNDLDRFPLSSVDTLVPRLIFHACSKNIIRFTPSVF